MDLESSDPLDTLILDESYWPETRVALNGGWVEWRTWEKIMDQSKIGDGVHEVEKWEEFAGHWGSEVNQTVGLSGPAGGVTAWGELNRVLTVRGDRCHLHIHPTFSSCSLKKC